MHSPSAPSRALYLVPFALVGLLMVMFIALIWLRDGFSVSADQTGGASTQIHEPQPIAPALNLEGFDPGNLISNEVFYDYQSMSEQDIADFISKWNAGCQSGVDGAPCLAQFKENSPSWASDQYCPSDFVGQKADSASSIIYKVSQACQINPQVLLTTLQKEQGLLTASGMSLSQSDYKIAMGYGCPDGRTCDPKYQGFTRQVYNAAHQFQMYRVNPFAYDVIGGAENDIAYHVNADCGSGKLFIKTQATAGLYNYTPYQPTRATLDGQAEKCSTWGNMNFYGLFNAWFGDPHGVR